MAPADDPHLGPGDAPQQPQADLIAGRLVTETLDYDGGRKVTVYLPPAEPCGIVFAGDGQLLSQWGAGLELVAAPPTMIVGVHRTGAHDEMVRLGEYSPSFDTARFAAHEKFFTDVIASWIHSRFGVELPAGRSAVAGVSASAELALAMGLRHPDRYGIVFAASPGAGYRPPAMLPSHLPRTYLTAGTLEPFFLDNATRWADALQAAGADVVMSEQVGDHGDPFWQTEFARMVHWAFGPV